MPGSAGADPEVRVIYEELARREGLSVFAAAHSDYFKGIDLLDGK
jgi:hypothetical protein